MSENKYDMHIYYVIIYFVIYIANNSYNEDCFSSTLKYIKGTLNNIKWVTIILWSSYIDKLKTYKNALCISHLLANINYEITK